MKDRILAWMFLIIFLLDITALWLIAFFANIRIPFVAQVVLFMVLILVVIGSIILVWHHNNKEDK